MAKSRKQQTELGTERIRKIIDAIRNPRNYRNDRLITLQHGRQYLYRTRSGVPWLFQDWQLLSLL